LKKRVWLALIPVAAVAIVLLLFGSAWTATAETSPNPQAKPPTDYPATGVTSPTPHYLTGLPYYPNNTYKVNKIFLESSHNWIGYSNSTIAKKLGIKDPNGSNVLIINGTIRNDYSAQEIIQWSQEGAGSVYIGLDAYLYDAQGNLLNVVERGNPFRGAYEISFRGGEETNYNMVFITNSTVAYYEIYVSYMRPIPQF
jgi:hypothetical protein